MKIQLIYAMAQLGPKGELIVHAPGDIVEMDEKEAQILVEQGQAVAIEEPKPAKKKVL
jgi:hypothetical protein